MPQLESNSTRKLLWRPIRRQQNQHPPAFLQHWLSDPGSLTARLIAKSQGEFQVEVVRQVVGRPRLNECQVLGIRSTSLALIREVILKGNNQPWVFARSLLPLSSLTGELRHLRKQTNRPLGAFLFSQPHLVRSPIAIAAISRDHAYVPAHLAGSEPLWGRRSVFSLDGKPLLVSEVFLPDFVNSLSNQKT
ncbi:MAG: chorismate--pyruvate lyase [Cellvibrio sp. 79]|nr:MAG: chorismate--pyruvate lyase [Cellvibrio sp. 79]